MKPKFTKKIFSYFEQAQKNRKNKKWYEKNKPLYETEVYEPMRELSLRMHEELGKSLPKVDVSPRKITKPFYYANNVPKDGSIVKSHTYVYFCEKNTSFYEWNPGIYLSIGAADDSNVMGVGLYSLSGRQRSLLRDGVFERYGEIDAILKDPKLRKYWGEVQGERYKRFPRGYNPESKNAKYLWYKQFYFSQELKRKDILSPSFAEKVVREFRATLPFFKWIRSTVGVYKRQEGRRLVEEDEL